MEPLSRRDPRKVGPYRLVGRLGGGGMGQVYLGRSEGGRPVAVKVVRQELAADPGFRRRFAREVTAARKVGGFHTAQVVDADPTADPPWLVTAYIPGPSLQAAVQEDGPLPLKSAAALGAGLAEGLAVVHACGLVHRDLKPSNVILAEDGPRVIDFGIVRALDATSHTLSRAVVGTPAFMSPEQARGDPVGPASDVFSLGSVLMFAVTGRGPFGEGPSHALMYRIVHDDPDLDGLPGELRDLVVDCLAKDPGMRPAVADVLRRIRATDPRMKTWQLPEPVRRETLVAAHPAPPQPAEEPPRPILPQRQGRSADTGTGVGSALRRLPPIGGFGVFDEVAPAEPCQDCGHGKARSTDLFCPDHDRFLPLATRTNVQRAGIVLSGAALVYALLWLTAELGSHVTAFLATAATGMLVYLLPLRRHEAPAIFMAAAAYVLAFITMFLIYATEGDSRRLLVSTAFFAVVILPAAHAILGALGTTGDDKQIFARGPANGTVALGSIPAAFTLAGGLGWLLTPLLGDAVHGERLRAIFAFTTVLALFLSLGISGVVGFTEGMRRVSRESPRFRRPRTARHVTWRAAFSDAERVRAATAVDRLGELARITAIRVTDVARITLVTGARVTVNALADLSRLLVVLVIEAVNLVVKAGVLVLRSIVAVAVGFAESAAKLLGFGVGTGAWAFAALALPVAALLGAATLSVALSEHLRDYIDDGAFADLGWFTAQAAAALAMVSSAWILSAHQNIGLSLISAHRSANIAGPYLLVFIAIGGWLFTALSFLGIGDVRAGWATWTATALLVAAFMWSRWRHRAT
ncbi:serine/threonine-protein kinase [Actinomadura sp. 7K507]|uniref:serine/threonine-protein kinase n=1 Tax=Actinomadura sp. 7K507 TaxID=2530365 RepID=UPI00104E10AD|nr:serine/threonine-protein kinase [Actinomadura sp. 7K507]TDC94310.1 serine/threonine protein kinase [Actinomadura sp. 7K507]